MAQEPTDILLLSHDKQEQVAGRGNQVGGPTGITADRHTGAQSAKSPGQGWYACASPDQGTSDPGPRGKQHAKRPDAGAELVAAVFVACGDEDSGHLRDRKTPQAGDGSGG